MVIGEKYYSIVYISEILLFFQTTLFLFRKFSKRLYSTSLNEKDFDGCNKQVKHIFYSLVKLTPREHNIRIGNR